jgi:Tfp pilus assembly protein PilV
MDKKNGYYLAEVLVALVIFSFSSLSLFKYQWRLLKTTDSLNSAWFALRLIDNVSERVLAGDTSASQIFEEKAKSKLPSGHARITTKNTMTTLVITWIDNHSTPYQKRTLIRIL